MKAVILAAGMGTRLGRDVPKPLTPLPNDETILAYQIRHLLEYVRIQDVYLVVGYAKEVLMDAVPEATFVYNPRFATTNTAKSLLIALERLDDDVLMINGDVVFEPDVLRRVADAPGDAMATNRAPVADEEVKYTLDDDGYIARVSKEVTHGIGEALGLNKFTKGSIARLNTQLAAVHDQDYFENAIERAIEEGLRILPIDCTELFCIEIDFIEDLERAQSWFTGTGATP